MLSQLETWIRALGVNELNLLNHDVASTFLRGILRDKAALLVVDDAWNLEDVDPFRVGGPGCHLLVTAREAVVAHGLHVQPIDLEVMTNEQAVDLMARRIGQPAFEGLELERAMELSEELGYLPLALELSAVQIAEGIPWSRLLSELRTEVARLEILESFDPTEIANEMPGRTSVYAPLFP